MSEGTRLRLFDTDVHEFLRVVCRRDRCPSCGTTKAPLIGERASLYGTDRVLYDAEIGSMQVSDHGHGTTHLPLIFTPLVIVCPVCGSVTLHRRETVEEWLRTAVRATSEV